MNKLGLSNFVIVLHRFYLIWGRWKCLKDMKLSNVHMRHVKEEVWKPHPQIFKHLQWLVIKNLCSTYVTSRDDRLLIESAVLITQYLLRPIARTVCPYISDILFIWLAVFTNWETSNRYAVKNSLGQQVFFASEESDNFQRQCCGPARGFVMHIADNGGQVSGIQQDASPY